MIPASEQKGQSKMTLEIEDSQLKLPPTSIERPPDRELELPSQALAQMSPVLQALAQAKPVSQALDQIVASLNRELESPYRALDQMMASLNRAQMSPVLQALAQAKQASRAFAQVAALNRELNLSSISRVLELQKPMLKPLTPQVLEPLTPHVRRDSTLYTVGGTDGIYMPERDGENKKPLLFISHSSKDEDLAAEISVELSHLDIASFVAHRDIEPMADWWSVLIHTLGMVDGLIALLTPHFKSSDWTNQEVGAVLGRGVPTITVQLGVEPYGFMSKWQAIQGSSKDPRSIANEIRDAFIKSKRPRQTRAYPTWV